MRQIRIDLRAARRADEPGRASWWWRANRLVELAARVDAIPSWARSASGSRGSSGEVQAEVHRGADDAGVARCSTAFPALVRDLARDLGKQVRLEVEGEEIELDRAILDEIGDPLVHLLRNAVDHGIEAPARAGEGGEAGRGTARCSRRRASGTAWRSGWPTTAAGSTARRSWPRRRRDGLVGRRGGDR